MKSKTSKKIALVAFLSALTLSTSAVGFVSLEKDTFSPLATITVSADETSVAKVGSTEYATISEAFADVNDGDTITFLEDIANLEVTIKNDVTLDLNGKTITDAYVIVEGEVTIKNGSIVNTNEPYPLVVQNGGKLTVENVAIEASKSDRAISVKSGSSLIFNSGSILATKGANNTKTSLIAAIYTDSNTDVTINGGTITVDTPNNKAVGIYGNYTNANVTVNGGKISTSGKNYCYGINVDGDIAVNGGEIVTNEKGYGYDSGVRYGNNYALVSATGDVTITGGKITTNGFSGYIVSVGRSYSSNDQTVTISGGELTNNLSEVEQTTGGHKAPVLVWEDSASNVTATITDGTVKGFSAELLKGDSTTLEVSGGTFDVAVNEKYWAENFEIVENADGSYTVKEQPKGSIMYCYTSASAFWGEGSSNAAESYVVELYEGETKIAYASLNDVNNIIDGTYKNLTWYIPFAGSNDPYWTVEWAENYPKYDMNPDTVKLVVDGVVVSTNDVKWSGADDVAKIVALAENATGDVVAYTSLATAMNDGAKKINVIRDVTENLTAIENVTLTSNSNVTITSTYSEDYINFNNVTIGSGITLNAPNLYSSGNDSVNVIEGTVNVSGTYYHSSNAKTIVQNGGKVTTVGMTVVRYNTNADAGIYIYGDNDATTVEWSCANTFSAYSGKFYAEDAVIETKMLWLDYKKNNNEEADKYSQINAEFVNSTVTVTSEFRFYKDATATLTNSNVSAGKVQIRENATPVIEMDSASVIKATTVENLSGATTNAVLGEDGIVSFKKFVASVNGTSYATLQEAIDVADGATVTLLSDLTIESDLNNAGKGYFNIADGKNVTLDLNGKTITATDHSAGNFILFYNYGTFTIKNGTIELTATSNRKWNAESAIVLNRGGVLNVESGTYTHNGGTDMAFVFDNSGNHYGDATMNIYGGELTSTYVAIRNRMEQNSHGASGKTTLNVTNGTISGTSRAIWAQASSTSETSPATGAINVTGGKVGLIDTPRSTGAVSMTTISGGEVDSVKCEVGELTITGGTVGEKTILTTTGETANYIVNEDGEYVTPAVMVGENGYGTLEEALAATKTMTGAVTVEILNKVTLNQSLVGSYDSIAFVGKTENAEIYLDVQGYITATGKEVSFTDLKLSKSEGGYVANAGFMNLAFGIFDVEEITYTNCTFANGACASFGDVTFKDCTFYRSHDRYGLWAYGNVNVTVDGCTFADIRGIKMYAEGLAKTVALTVKDTDFSAVTDKPAIVLTCGESVTLKGNTYNPTKGAVELDLDGAPNGTLFKTDDLTIQFVNDNGECGVLVDGKIYTTVAQAAEVATAGSTVTLLHASTETVALPAGVTLKKNGYEATGVTVKVYVAKIGDVGFVSVADALTYAQENGITDLEITLCGETSKGNTDAFNLYMKTQFDSVTFKQEDASKVYYLYDICTGERTNGGEFVFDGVNIVVTDQYIFEGNVRLTNNSVVKSTAAANCFQYYSTTTIEPGSKLYGVIDDFRGGDVIVDGGRTDGAYNETPDMKDAILTIRWSGDSLTVKNGAYVNVNAANEVGRVTINAGASLNVDDSKFDAWQWIENNGTINVDTESAIKTQKVIGAGKITVDATNFSRSVCVIKADFSAFTGTIAITGNNDVTYEIKDDGLYLVEKPKVAEVNGNSYTSLEEAAANAVAGDTITLLADVTLSAELTLPAGITLNGNGKTINGTIKAGGDLTFAGSTTVSTFNPGWFNNTITIGEGASLKVTSGRMTVSYGNVFNIIGSIEDAKTTVKTNVTPSLELVKGISFNGNGSGVQFNVTNAYVILGDSSTKNSGATGEFNLNFTNSIVDFTKTLKTYMPTAAGLAPKMKITAKDSEITFASHLELLLDQTTMTLDNSNLTVGGSFANAGTINVTNDANFVVKAPIMSSHGGNTGTINVVSGTFELVDSNEDWQNAGTIKVYANGGKLITNDFKCVNDGMIVVDASELAFDEAITAVDGNGVYSFEGVVKLENATNVTVSYENGDVVLTKKPVAQIGETKYATLQEAIDAAQAGETVTLVADVTLKDTLHIVEGKVVTLDLNGKTISQVKEQTAGYQMILNDGKLIINDSVGTGLISYTDSGNGGEYISDTIYNRSVLVINGGKIENISSATVARNGYPHAVDTYSGIRDTSVTINGGVIYCKEYSAIRMFCVSATYEADLVINDGATIKGAIDMQNGTKNSALGSLTINGGTFKTTANANNVRFANWNGGATEYGIEAEITGGTFNGGFTTAYVPAAANFNKKFVSGGTFATDISEYCAEGFRAVENTDGTYGVVQKYKFYGANLTIGSDLTVNYFVKLTDEEAAKMVVDFKFEHWTSTIRVSGERYNSTYYVFHFEHVAPQQMGDVIIASLKMMNDSGEYVEVDLKDDYSVKAYAYHELSRTSIEGYSEAEIQALHTLMADMLNYGAAAQLYKNYKVDSLVNAELTVSGSTFTAPTDSDASLSGSNSIKNFSATLVYDHANSIRVYFVPADLNAVSVKVVVGAKITDLAIQETTDGRYYVQVDDIEATHFADIYYFVFNDSSENEVVISYSVKSYVYNKHNSETDGELIRALWNYGNSAVAYKKTK